MTLNTKLIPAARCSTSVRKLICNGSTSSTLMFSPRFWYLFGFIKLEHVLSFLEEFWNSFDSFLCSFTYSSIYSEVYS